MDQIVLRAIRKPSAGDHQDDNTTCGRTGFGGSNENQDPNQKEVLDLEDQAE